MSRRPIIDAGPGLNFFSINRERLLIGTLGPLSAPEIVRDELLRKSREDRRFYSAETVWRKLTPKWIQILPDEVTDDLAVVVNRISGMPMQERLKQPKDLGEIMVIAHAVVAAEIGDDVTVLIDDGAGARVATSEINRLGRLKRAGQKVGAIQLVSTLMVLEIAASTQHLPDKAAMRDIYGRLRSLDDGLPPIEGTNLLSPGLWT